MRATDLSPSDLGARGKQVSIVLFGRESAFAALTASLALAGCAHFVPEPIEPARVAADFEARSLDAPELETFLETTLQRQLADWPPKAWDLEMLTLAALYYNPSLEVARAHWKVSEAGVQTAGGRPNPTIGLTPGYSSNAAIGTSPWFPGLTFDIPIETAGKRDIRITEAAQLSESARLGIASAAWQVRGDVRAAVIAYESARRREKLLRRLAATQEQTVARLDERLSAGAVSSYEVSNARLTLTRTRLDAQEAHRQLREQLVSVADAVGVPAASLAQVTVRLDWSVPTATELTSAALRRQALTSRPDILAALSDYAASQSALQLEIAKQYPDIHIGPGYQFDQGENKWSIGIVLELPLFNANEGPIAEATARRAEAAAQFEALQARVVGEIDRAVAAFESAQARLSELRQLHAQLERRSGSVSARQELGAADSLDVLTAEGELINGELMELDGETSVLQALNALEGAIQRPFAALETIEHRPAAREEENP